MTSLRVRLTLWYGAVLLAVLLLFSAGLYASLKATLYAQFDANLREEAARLAEETEWEDDGEFDLETDVLLRGERVAAYGRDGKLIALHGGSPGPRGARPGQLDTYAAEGVTWRRMTVDAPALGVVLELSRPQQDLRHFLGQFLQLLLAAVPLTLAVAGAGGLFLASRALRPLADVTRTAASLSPEDLSQRLQPLQTRDELAQLVDTFNGMLVRLEEGFERQRQFTADAAHELRTPLAALLVQAELGLERERPAAEYRGFLEAIVAGAQRMSQLVGRLLTLARTEGGTVPLDLESLDLASLVEDATATVAAAAPDVHFEQHLDPVQVRGDQTMLTEAVWNLLDNAASHGAHVRVEVRREGSQAVVRVTDDGPGLASEHQARIFERFYQADAARARTGRGNSGLGLAICRATARRHGGDVTVRSEPGQGAEFTLRLPQELSLGAGKCLG